MNAKFAKVASQFTAYQSLQSIVPLGGGLINDTFLVTGQQRFVLQRLNAHVFSHPEWVMQNLHALGQHLQTKQPQTVHLQIPSIIPTHDGRLFYLDEAKKVWRALQLISPAESRDQLHHVDEAAQIGFALAHFHRLCSDLQPALLKDTLPGFHVTPGYFDRYQQLLAEPLQVVEDAGFRQCKAFIETHQAGIDILERGKQNGELLEQVIHGDPKLNNFLFLPGSSQVVSLIDLDTVKPGLLHYDIGDCIRACCHEKTGNRFNLNLCRIILTHYLQEIGMTFKTADYDYLYSAIWLIPFELGLRFFNDYLEGNHYFKIDHPRQNLQRAQSQFAFCDSIQRQKSALMDCISHLRQHPLPV